jgi:hypothetical protein
MAVLSNSYKHPIELHKQKSESSGLFAQALLNKRTAGHVNTSAHINHYRDDARHFKGGCKSNATLGIMLTKQHEEELPPSMISFRKLLNLNVSFKIRLNLN